MCVSNKRKTVLPFFNSRLIYRFLIRNCSRLSYLFHAADGALRGVPAGRGSERPYERSKRKTTVLRLRSEKDGSEGEASPFVKDSNKRID